MDKHPPRAIAHGPSKFELMVAFFDRAGSSPRTVTFTLVGEEKVEVVVNGIETESGSGEEWLFKGYRLHRQTDGPAPANVRGFYSTKQRKGWIQSQ